MKKKEQTYKNITDDMVGLDEKICKCSSHVADLIKQTENINPSKSLFFYLNKIKKRND